MPRGYRRTSSNIERFVDRGSCPISKRYHDKKKSKFNLKEHQGPEPSEQRFIILTYGTLELNELKFLAPIYLPVQASDLRNHLCSEHASEDIHELSRPLFIFPVDLANEEKVNLSESGSKQTKSENNSSFLSESFSGVVDGSNVSDDNKTAKRISRKKRKKKGKQRKKSTNKKVSPVSETQYEEGVCDASLSETISSDTASSFEHNSQKTMAVEDIAIEQDENKAGDNDYIENCSDDVEARSAAMDDDRPYPSMAGISLSKPSFHSILEDFSDNNSELFSSYSTDHFVVDTDNGSERAQYSSETSSSDDFQTVVYRKKGRLAKRNTQSYNGLHRFGTANPYDQKVNHSIWQSVQRNTQQYNRQEKKVDVINRRVEISRRGSEMKTMPGRTTLIDFIKPSANVISSNEFTSEALDGRYDVPEKIKRKAIAYNQGNCCFMKESNTDKNKDQNSKTHLQQEGLDISTQETHPQMNILFSTASDSLNHTEIKVQFGTINVAQEDFCNYTDTEDVRKREIVSSHEGKSKLVRTSVSVLQKRSSVEMKDSSVLIPIQTGNLNGSVVDESAADSLNSKNKERELLTLKSHHSLLPCLGLVSEDKGCPSSDPDIGVPAQSNHCLNLEVKDLSFSSFDPDLIKIVQAVGDSYKSQSPSQGVQLLTGSPVAEFEKFLRSASPVLDRTYFTESCKTCSRDQLIFGSLCPHQKISLGNLWEWYEKPGSYGLEVKVEDYYDSKRSRRGLSEFHAYFVPYLSAIQLFGRPRNYVLADNGDLHEELLFEYFESDQPQQRKSLYEKIKELVKNDTSSSCHMSGDPLMLECLNLNDLHPASWYSVAWYPIYRIPHGNFRASFLTYHSLGQFVQVASKTPGVVANVVSPVVGLQSYNAKGECWFRAKRSDSKTAARPEEVKSSSEDSEIVERLRMLERTASVMARASVRKGDRRCANKQPDYEFFVSRRW